MKATLPNAVGFMAATLSGNDAFWGVGAMFYLVSMARIVLSTDGRGVWDEVAGTRLATKPNLSASTK